jgi:hypothetical protein
MTAVAPLFHAPPPGDGEPDESALVIEDDAPVDSILTEKQERLLTEPLYSSWIGPPPGPDGAARPFAALANVGLFSTPDEQPVVPDVMLSLDVKIPEDQSEKKNRSYFLWRYGKPPEVVIEIVSNRQGAELDEKFRRYRRLRVDYYIVYDPMKILSLATLQVFELHVGMYVALDRPWLDTVGLGLVEWEGAFEGMRGRWLRWHTRGGQLLPTGAERAENEKARAENEKARAENEKARAENEKARAENEKARAENEKARADDAEARALRLAARLRELGIDPNGDA